MDILGKLSDFGKNVAQKSGELAEASKLTVNIKSKEREIKSLKLEIGDYIYNKFAEGAEFDDEVAAFCKDIDVARAEIAKLKEQKEAIGLSDEDIEVVEAETSDLDDDFEITPEDEEILKEI